MRPARIRHKRPGARRSPPTILAEGASNDISSNHTSWRRAQAPRRRSGYGLVLFAAILVASIGCFNLVHGSRQNLAAA